MEKKYCSGCQRDKAVDLFTEPYKMCNRCRERAGGSNKSYIIVMYAIVI